MQEQFNPTQSCCKTLARRHHRHRHQQDMTVGKENPFEIIFSTKKRRISDQIDQQRNHLVDREPNTSQSVFVEHEQSIENTAKVSSKYAPNLQTNRRF